MIGSWRCAHGLSAIVLVFPDHRRRHSVRPSLSYLTVGVKQRLTSTYISIILDIWNHGKPFWRYPRWRSRRGSACSGFWSSTSLMASRRGISQGRLRFRKTRCRPISRYLRACGPGDERAESRSIIYRADLAAFQSLTSFMVEDCCGGRAELCAPAAACKPARGKRTKITA